MSWMQLSLYGKQLIIWSADGLPTIGSKACSKQDKTLEFSIEDAGVSISSRYGTIPAWIRLQHTTVQLANNTEYKGRKNYDDGIRVYYMYLY